MGLVSYLALKEYLSLIPTRRADRSRQAEKQAYSVNPRSPWNSAQFFRLLILFILSIHAQ